MQGIANPRSNLAQSHYSNFFTIKKRVWETLSMTWFFYESGRQDSNLRPSAPKALDTPKRALRFRAITNNLHSIALLVISIMRRIDIRMTSLIFNIEKLNFSALDSFFI